MTRRQHVSRDAQGGALISAVIAMAVVTLLIPGLLLLLHRSNRLATAQPDNDEGLQARAELAEMFSQIDPIGRCDSPFGAAFRDVCFRESVTAGASLIQTPEMPAAEPHSRASACWLTIQPAPLPRQRRCLVLEGGSDKLQCDPANRSNCLRVLSEATGEPVMVDEHGGGLLMIRSWDEEPTDPCFQREYLKLSGGVPLTNDVPDRPFLPSPACFPEATVSDRIIYTDVEWSCVRWRHSYDADFNRDGDLTDPGEWAAHQWLGGCPDPADPTETWPPNAGLPSPATAGVTLNGLELSYSHALGDPITDVEVLVCLASNYQDRIQGAPHCSVDRMRFRVADGDGPPPPIPVVPALLPESTVSANGVTVTEGDTAGISFQLGLTLAPLADVTVTANPPPGVTITPATWTFTTADWTLPQTVTVTAADETLPDRANETVTITFTTASTDTDYDARTTSVEVTIADDDHPNLLVGSDSVIVDESGTATFTVTLKGRHPAPSAAVTVTATSSDTTAVAAPSTPLSFATSDTTQTVTVTAAEDDDASDESVTLTLTTATTSATDADYDNLVASVTVEVTDDDTPALVLTSDSVTVDEGDTATVDVSLATEPSEPVTVNVTSADPAAAAVTPATLTFTAANWDTPQTVTVTGVEDDDAEDETTTAAVAAQDGDYRGITAQVTVTVIDDDPLTGCALVQSLTDAQLSDVVSVAVQGAFLTDLDADKRIDLAVDWQDDGSLTISAASLIEVTLAGSPPVVIADMTTLISVVLGPISYDPAVELLAWPGTWFNEADANGSFTVEGSYVDSVVRSVDCGG